MIVATCLLVFALGTAPEPIDSTAKSEVRDSAHLFNAETIKKALTVLQTTEKNGGLPTLIETVENLGGEKVEDVAKERSTEANHDGIYVLIAKKEAKIDVLLSRKYHHPSLPATVRESFVADFKKGDFNAGLLNATKVISEQFDKPTAAAAIDLPKPKPAFPGLFLEAPLVSKNQYRLTLAGARTVLVAAEAKATLMDVKMNIAVVDDGGHLMCFGRMDGGRPASATTALTKAISAATFRMPTGPMPKGVTPPDMLLSLSIQNAAAASGGKVTTLLGGIPIIVEGQVIGAIGVGGGSGDQDVEVAQAGVDEFMKHMKKDEHPETK